MANNTPTNTAPINIPPKASGPSTIPTAIGATMANNPGNTISFKAPLVLISTHLAESGLAFPSFRPGISLNCLRTSSIIRKAVFPTAFMAKAEKR